MGDLRGAGASRNRDSVAGFYSSHIPLLCPAVSSRATATAVAVAHDHRNKPMTVDIIAFRACTCASVAHSILAEASLPELGAR